MAAVRAIQLGLMVVYASYLTNVGLLLVLLPWSDAWVRLVVLTPPKIGFVLDSPAFRGAISAFGILHLLLLFVELVGPASRLRPDDRGDR